MVLRRSVYRRLAVTWIAAALFLVSGCSGGDSGGGNFGSTPAITAGKVTFVNHCAVDLTIYETSREFAAFTLSANGGKTQEIALSQFKVGKGYNFMSYPNTATIPDVYCDGWTDLGGSPGTIQRTGFMWEGANVTYAAYCVPGLSGFGNCVKLPSGSCAGPGMVSQYGTFGTQWEFNLKGGGSNDYVDLSTNYGIDSTHPWPKLCPPDGPRSDDCVAKSANIFFNVPVKWTTNKDCSFTTKNTPVKGLKCLTADCPDAYRHPMDDKQCACTSSDDSGYLVEYCPDGVQLPPVPTK